jgi:hypothetical protein
MFAPEVFDALLTLAIACPAIFLLATKASVLGVGKD